MKRNIKIAITTCIIFALSACSSIPLTSMWKLRNVSPLEADPALFKIAVISNELIQLKDNSTSIALGFTSENSSYSFKTEVMASVNPNAIESELEPYRQSKERITLFTLNEDAVRQLRIAQSRIQTIKEKEIEGDGSLAVSIHTGCINGPKPKTVKANIFVSFAPSQGFVKLISNIDLLKREEKFWVECDKS